MKRYPAWQAFYRSFYSMDFYRDVAEHWGEVGFLHLFLLAGVYWLTFAICIQLVMVPLIDKWFLPIADQLPTLSTTADHHFKIDKPSPYRVTVNDRTLFTFDTTGNTQALDQPGFLVTDREILFFKGDGTMQKSVEAKDVTSSISGATVRDGIVMIKTFLWGVILIGGWFFGTIFLFTLDLVYALIGLVINAITEANLSFGKIMRLAAIAITPPVVVEIVVRTCLIFASSNLGLQGVADLLFRTACFGMSMTFLFLGINAAKQTTSVDLPPPADMPLQR